MSADNGIYILKTTEGQYRVLNTTAIENIFWNEEIKEYQKEPIPKTLYEYFNQCKYTYNGNKAINIAIKMTEKTPLLEYGIKIIPTNLEWKEIIRQI